MFCNVWRGREHFALVNEVHFKLLQNLRFDVIAASSVGALNGVFQFADFAEAFAFLQRLCATTLFQPESPDAPIQILGVLESAGLRFDCLWVSGLTDEAWPMQARPKRGRERSRVGLQC